MHVRNLWKNYISIKNGQLVTVNASVSKHKARIYREKTHVLEELFLLSAVDIEFQASVPAVGFRRRSIRTAMPAV